MTGVVDTFPAGFGDRTTAPRPARALAASLALGLCIALGGCSTVPKSGPLVATVNHEAREAAPPFLLVPVNRTALTELAKIKAEEFVALAINQPAPDVMIHRGDKVSITLWEYGSGLLGPVPSTGQATIGLVGAQSASVPTQSVDQAGTIIVPFAGEIKAAGRTTRQVEAAIVQALRGKATNAQALVQIMQTTDNSVTVTGDVNHPGRITLAPTGTHLLDALSEAGGTTGRARDMLVHLTRAGKITSTRLSVINADPVQNIFLKSGDLLTLDLEPQSVVVLGATNKNLDVPFDKDRMTLAETLGAGGGLADRQADPYGVYVLRYEKLPVARTLTTRALPDYLQAGELVPVVYQIDMRSADGLMLSQNFMMRDHDLVYVANAPAVQIGKLTSLFNSIAGIFKSNSLNAYNY